MLPLEELKIRAGLLSKQLRRGTGEEALAAARRLQLAPALSSRSPEEILAGRERVRRKHALDAVAVEQGFSNWRELAASGAFGFDTTRLFHSRSGGFLNQWFARYEDARAALERDGGFLFPYRRQYFVCEAAFLEAAGINTGEADWEKIGCDWVRPRDRRAKSRLELALSRNPALVAVEYRLP